MKFGELPLVNVEKVIDYYNKKGLYTDLLSRCNSQEFRYINGFGKGHFLSTTLTTAESVLLTIDEREVDVKILEVFSLEHPDHPAGLYVYVTGEFKCGFLEGTVARNYNVTIDKTLSSYDPPDIIVMEDDNVHWTLQDIIADIIQPFSLSYDAQDIYCYDVPLQGMSVFKAIDHLCSIYGLLWTADASSVKITAISEEHTLQEASKERLNAIEWSQLPVSVSDISVSFPIYDYARQTPGEYWYSLEQTTNQGIGVNVCDPYFPSVEAINGTLRNRVPLEDRTALIKSNLFGITKLANYLEKHHYECGAYDQTSPPYAFISLSEVFGDWGYGPRSVYREIPWPYYTPPMPRQAKARYANNWRGILAYSYYTVVPYFVVTPVVGFDGRIPPDPQRVENIYGWNYGEVGWAIRVEWNPVDAVWEAIQQEYICPPTIETPVYDPPDYEPPYSPPTYVPGGGPE